MNILFYITNHGYGHASRNVPVILELLSRGSKIFIKSDSERCAFLKRNIENTNVEYYEDIHEVGLLLFKGHMNPDIEGMKKAIVDNHVQWDDLIEREVDFIKSKAIDVVFSDTVAIGIQSAHKAGVRSILAGNFDWALIYNNYYDKSIWGHYLDSYRLADKAIWYELHDLSLEKHNDNSINLSLLSRTVNRGEVARIKSRHNNPIVFVSLGGSAELEKEIDVSDLNYDFLTTKGLNLVGNNVYRLPENMINTPDYIAASEYVISKGGWSTVAEILLQHKKAVLIMRTDNPEDDRTKEVLTKRNHCIAIDGEDRLDFKDLLNRLSRLEPSPYDIYSDDCLKVCDIICGAI